LSEKSGRPRGQFSDEDYRRILMFRTRIREFLAWSAAQARAAGVTPAQHQLLLAVRGHLGPDGPSVGEIARYLHLRHHSAVELIDRAELAGLVRRTTDASDRRLARVELEPKGEALLAELTAAHAKELRLLAQGAALVPTVPDPFSEC